MAMENVGCPEPWVGQLGERTPEYEPGPQVCQLSKAKARVQRSEQLQEEARSATSWELLVGWLWPGSGLRSC